MYLCNIFECIPYVEITRSASLLYTLVVSQAYPQLVRQGLLRQPGFLPGLFQILSHFSSPAAALCDAGEVSANLVRFSPRQAL